MNQQNNLPRTLTGQVYQGLRNRILTQAIPPGSHLIVGQIAEEMSVSLSPVREALRLLENDGLVRVEPHRGAITHIPSKEEFQQLFVVRRNLESLAVQLSGGLVTEAELEPLREIMDRGAQSVKKKDFESWVTVDSEFHQFFANHCGNDVLKQMLFQMQGMIEIYRRVTRYKRPFYDAAISGHQTIYELFIAGQADKAAAAMVEHIDTSEEYGIACFDSAP